MWAEESCELGPDTTTCLLEWTWRAMEYKQMGTRQFLERMIKLDNDATYLQLDTNEIWHPEDRLLAFRSCYVPASETEPVANLLNTWETIAAQQGKRLRAAACQLQRVAMTSANVWPAMMRAFTEFESQGGSREISEKLFAEWRDKVVEWCAPYREHNKPADSSWVY
jgi:hypothetical protein